MGLTSALSTALTGLQASETTINVVGNNIANSNTVGFKESDVVFATQFLQTLSIGSAPSGSLGGTNPRQIGLGVKVAAISPDFSQGTIEISSNPLDIAIQGDGFLVVQDSQGGQLYTRNGQLQLNSANQLVTSSGQRVLGYGVDSNFELDESQPTPIVVPLGDERVAQATGSATLGGVLNPTVAAGNLPEVVSSQVLGDASVDFVDDTDFGTADLSILSPPSLPTSTTTNNTGSATGLSLGTYTYRVAYVDANSQESSASTEFSVTVADPNEEIVIAGLATTAPTDSPWTGYNLYRTEADGTTFYPVNSTPIALASADPINDVLADTTLDDGTAKTFNAIDNGSYTYYVTYYNSAGGQNAESRPSAALGPFAIGDDISSIHLDLSDIDAPAADSGFNQLRIYRNSSADSSTFSLVGTVAAPVEGVTYTGSFVDTTPSSSLSTTDTLDFDGARAGLGTLLTDVQVRDAQGNYTTPFQAGVLSFTGEKASAELETKELTITATTTVSELLSFIDQATGIQQLSGSPNDFPLPAGAGVTIADGVIQVTSNLGTANAINIPLTAFQLLPTGSVVTQSVDVLFSQTQAADGPGTTTEFVVYDSLGSPLSVQVTTVLENRDANSTTYRWFATSGDSNPAAPDQSIDVGNGVLVFDANGNLQTAPNSRISVRRDLTASQSPLEVALDFTSVRSLAETDALGSATSSLNVTRQDGFPPGVLTDFIITESGRIQGQFSNGTQRDLGQMLMARFANASGLTQVGDSLFQVGVNSGDAIIGEPGEDGIGTLTAGAVELSNTDIGQNLIELILASTQYRGGSRVITAAQELLDELLALRR
ncbi:MAG: flagellar hook-basal body complex protein [Planctomycetota bacterium]